MKSWVESGGETLYTAEMVPKGFMCVPCIHVNRDCSHLPFDTYRPLIKHKDGVIEVKCEEFKRVS